MYLQPFESDLNVSDMFVIKKNIILLYLQFTLDGSGIRSYNL
jgi:hypothetical protein